MDRYNASKAAVIHLTKMLGFEIANNGLKVRVNSIAPGVFPSEMTTSESGDNQKSEIPKEEVRRFRWTANARLGLQRSVR